MQTIIPCLLSCRSDLRDELLLVAYNAVKGAAEMADYLDFVRRCCDSRTEWFETGLPWNPTDAIGISVYRAK